MSTTPKTFAADGRILQAEFAYRARQIAASNAEGPAQAKASAELLVATLASLGYGEGLDVLGPLLDAAAPGAAP
jgi:hypothetical protein